MTAQRWHPQGARTVWGKPAVGALVAADRQVWRILEIRDVPEIDYEADDRQGCYYVQFQHVKGGRRRHQKRQARDSWVVYPSKHYPTCSMCGEPWPCLHVDAKAHARGALRELDRLAAILPGCCWSCGEPITARQGCIVYEGENVLLPTAPTRPGFHTRRRCLHGAIAYEDRWVAADPSRPRSLLTLRCTGMLIVHGDGAAECFGAAGSACPSRWASHRAYAACFTQSAGCPRACPREGHPGCHPGGLRPDIPAIWPSGQAATTR